MSTAHTWTFFRLLKYMVLVVPKYNDVHPGCMWCFDGCIEITLKTVKLNNFMKLFTLVTNSNYCYIK